MHIQMFYPRIVLRYLVKINFHSQLIKLKIIMFSNLTLSNNG
jgi:hypothetical protein